MSIDERRETMMMLGSSLQEALKKMPATGLDGRLHPAPAALANVLKWLSADAASQATFQAWCQAMADGNAVLSEQLERDLKHAGYADYAPNLLLGNAEWRDWMQQWGGDIQQYAGKASHVRAREAYKAWMKAGGR